MHCKLNCAHFVNDLLTNSTKYNIAKNSDDSVVVPESSAKNELDVFCKLVELESGGEGAGVREREKEIDLVTCSERLAGEFSRAMCRARLCRQ